jgi:hypothetical protein
MANKAKTKRAASLAIQSPGKMTKRGRRDIAKWLRHHADCLIKYGDEYTEGRFTAGYHYR